ncbi:hypothetical protein JHK87_010121 [Glycine soja]|nr:hypothetical protein JHK87_010121 [Glycine soja]
MMPSFSILTVVFEGVYFESGGDRLLFLLGNTDLPISKPHVENRDITNSHWSGYSHQPHLLQDDQILLVLRYTQTFNLTSRAIKGEIRSISKHGSLKYFDIVYISSQLSRYSEYQFSLELMPRSCKDKHLCQDWKQYDALTFSGYEFCKTIQSISEPFNVVPNYKFTDRYAYQSKLRPLQPRKEFGFANWRLNQDTARERTGLSNLTLLAEGTWDSSSGKLCVIEFSGDVDSVLEECNYHISLYFPREYSIKQRSLMLGSISSIANETNMFFPLQINYAPHPVLLHLSLDPCGSYLSYNYTMIQIATSIRRRNQPSKFRLLKQSSLLKYPALEDEQDVLAAQLHFLSTNLSFDAYAICKHCSDKHNSRVFIHMDVFSLGIIFSQLSCMNRNAACIPHISHLMVTEQILGYGAELCRDTEILVESPHGLHDNKHMLNPLEIITRLLVLIALLITIRLYNKVSQTKKRQNVYGSNKEKRLSQHKNFVLWNLKVHIVGCLVLTSLLAIEPSLRNNLRSLGLIDFLLLPGVFIRQAHTLCAQDLFLVP